MPNRLLRAAALTSDTLDALSCEAERLFYRLLMVADDFGRFDGRANIVRSACFPLKVETLPAAKVGKWLEELRDANVLTIYEVGGHRYIQMHKWEGQRTRATASKFPGTDGALTVRAAEKPDGHVPGKGPRDDRHVTGTRPADDRGVTDKGPSDDGHVTHGSGSGSGYGYGSGLRVSDLAAVAADVKKSPKPKRAPADNDETRWLTEAATTVGLTLADVDGQGPRVRCSKLLTTHGKDKAFAILRALRAHAFYRDKAPSILLSDGGIQAGLIELTAPARPGRATYDPKADENAVGSTTIGFGSGR